jgi:hypothetical protein
VLDVDLRRPWRDWKASLKDRSGLDFGFDYISLGYVATQSLGEETAATGVFRLFGQWELTGRGTKNTGTLLFRVDNRHRLDTVPVKDFAGELGYAGIIGPTYSNQGNRLTHLYWNQNFAEGRGAVYLGFIDVTDYVDAYALASPWQGFANLAFQTGSGTMGGLPDAALGVAAGYFLNDNFYVGGGIADANADAADPFSNLFDKGETFKSFEVGWTTGSSARFFNNAHVTFYQIDEREEAGTPAGHGVAFHTAGSWMNIGFRSCVLDGQRQATVSMRPPSVPASDTARISAAAFSALASAGADRTKIRSVANWTISQFRGLSEVAAHREHRTDPEHAVPNKPCPEPHGGLDRALRPSAPSGLPLLGTPVVGRLREQNKGCGGLRGVTDKRLKVRGIDLVPVVRVRYTPKMIGQKTVGPSTMLPEANGRRPQTELTALKS